MEGTGKVSTVSFANPLVAREYLLPEEDRISPWEVAARDRVRFQRRIEEVGLILEPVLYTENAHTKTQNTQNGHKTHKINTK